MFEVIKIGDKTLPIRFGMNALRLYCKEQNVSLNEISKLGSNISLDEACCLILCGLKDGARKAKKEINFTIDDVADALDDDFSLLEKAMEIFAESFNTKTEGNSKEAAKRLKKK